MYVFRSFQKYVEVGISFKNDTALRRSAPPKSEAKTFMQHFQLGLVLADLNDI